MTIPGMDRMDVVSTNRQVGRLARTIENRAEDNSGKVSLFLKVYVAWDLWSIRTIGPWLTLGIRHGSDAYKGGRFLVEGYP